LEPIYNQQCIIRAFSLIKRNYPQAKLKVAGAGSEEGKLRELVQQMELRDVEFLGALTHERLARVYEESSIMINASLADNFPGSILEAFMCGLPVVTTSVGGIPWMVNDGVSGLLVPSDDHVSLADAVTRLVESPEMAMNIARNARAIAEKHRWEEIRMVLSSLYW
jgi:glycosyltransferase involved in cell wall biosynthesis